jgi:hypothetical protein
MDTPEGLSQVVDEETRFRTGKGNWDACFLSLDQLLAVASEWSNELKGINRPWLCWNVDSDWCLLQQKLVTSVGWTPVVGFDPRVGPPRLLPNACLVDFNRSLRLPILHPVFVMEFAFVMADRFAFWHSDLLVRIDKLVRYARTFSELSDGEMSAVAPHSGLNQRFRPWSVRYWELIGCTTRAASRSQFECGMGWWAHFYRHPNYRGKATFLGRPYNWDHGGGIMRWKQRTGGRVLAIPESEVAEGHFTSIGKKDYRRGSPANYRRNLAVDLSLNYELPACAEQLGLGSFLSN